MKFNFIGEKNYIDLQNLIKKINQNYPLKDSRNNDKKEIDQKISFEEIERIYELIIEINVLFRINFTRFYNLENDRFCIKNKNLEEEINKSISNEWFKNKKQSSVKKKSGYKDSQYGIALKLTNFPAETWTSVDIELATKKVSDRITGFIFSS
jgi:hypothetical protein